MIISCNYKLNYFFHQDHLHPCHLMCQLHVAARITSIIRYICSLGMYLKKKFTYGDQTLHGLSTTLILRDHKILMNA